MADKKKYDPSSPESKRQLAKVIAIVFVLTAGGGFLLAQRITKAEAAYTQLHGAKQPPVSGANNEK